MVLVSERGTQPKETDVMFAAELVDPPGFKPMYLTGWSRPRINGEVQKLARYGTADGPCAVLVWSTEAGASRAAADASKRSLTFRVVKF